MVLGLLAALGWGAWLRVRSEAAGQHSRMALQQLAISVQQYHQSRGFFPDDPSELAKVEPSFSYTTGLSDSVEVVSVAASPSGDLLGLAVFDHHTCTTIKVASQFSGTEPATASFAPTQVTPCTGRTALDQEGRQW